MPDATLQDPIDLIAEQVGDLRQTVEQLATERTSVEAARTVLEAAIKMMGAVQSQVLSTDIGRLQLALNDKAREFATEIHRCETGIAEMDRRAEEGDEAIKKASAEVTQKLRTDLDAARQKLATHDEWANRCELSLKEVHEKLAAIPTVLQGAEGKSLNPRGKYEVSGIYDRLDIVELAGSSYISAVDGNNEKPSPRSEKWKLLAKRGGGGGGGVSNDINALSGTLALNQGGTGATTAAVARTNLGLGSIATVDSPVPIADGGTGSTTAATAINALVPSQTGNADKVLKTDGSVVSWAATSNATAATDAQAAAGASTTTFLTPASVGYSAFRAALATRPGLISAGTSAAGTTQDNTGLAFALGDLTIGAWVRRSDWTPSGTLPIAYKLASNLGFRLEILATGVVRLGLGTGATVNSYDSTVATTLTDGAWAFVAATLDRDGNVTFYVNGAPLGTAVSIAALSAQTLTSTSPLYWMSNGSTHTDGTLGETFIVSGLLSASRIADIYRAGSIAPFCAYTANTTTGQNTATVDGLSFYQWCDFGQGYGPIIKDRSGNNQHALIGTSGIEHAVKRNPPGIPQRAPRAAIVGDGSAASFARNTLVSQTPGTGEFVLWADISSTMADANANGRTIAALSSSASETGSASTLWCFYNAADLIVRIHNSGADGSRWLTLANFVTHFANKRVVIAVRRSSAGLVVFTGVDGDFCNVTSLCTESTTGVSLPAWTDTVTGTYLISLYRNGTYSAAATLYDLRLANVAMTEAQMRTEYERGEPGAEWRGATKTAIASNTFDNEHAQWFSPNGVVLTDNAGFLSVATLGSGLSGDRIQRIIGSISRKYRVTIEYNAASSGTLVVGWGFAAADNFSSIAATGDGTWRTFTADLVCASFGGDNHLAIAGTLGAGAASFRNFSAVPIGYTARLRTDTAAGLTALNGAKSGTNDSTDFLLSTTGVTTSPDGRRQIIRATTNTSGNQQLLGASVIDTTKKWRIVSWNITSSGTPNVTLGSASAGTQYLASTAMAAALNEITLVTRIPASANLWCNSNSTATLEHVVILEQVE